MHCTNTTVGTGVCPACGAGQVKSPADGALGVTEAMLRDAQCVAGQGVCGTGQKAYFGACANCPAGTVGNLVKTECVICSNVTPGVCPSCGN
jgi:hypothetical protein